LEKGGKASRKREKEKHECQSQARSSTVNKKVTRRKPVASPVKQKQKHEKGRSGHVNEANLPYNTLRLANLPVVQLENIPSVETGTG
jgi:hypothetical protein